MSNIGHDLIHPAPRPIQAFVTQRRPSVLAHSARILSPHLRNAMQTTHICRHRTTHKQLINKAFRDMIAFGDIMQALFSSIKIQCKYMKVKYLNDFILQQSRYGRFLGL
jgi:hypothetical protein